MANAFAAFMQGQQAGQQARAIQRQRQDQNALRSLAPQVVAGDPAAYQQVAAIDPAAAQSYQGAGDAQARRLKGALDYFDRARASNNPAAVQAAFKTISPFMSQLTGQPAPEAYDEASMGPAFEQLKARVAMTPASAAGDVVQSQKVGADGFIYNTFRDGRIVNTGVKADRQMWLRDHPGMSPELVGKDGQIMPVGYGQSQGGPGMGAVEQIGGEQVRIDPSLPAEVQSQLRASLASGGPLPATLGTPAQARPSEAQTAAQVEAARQAAQLAYLPAQEAIKANAAVQQAAGVATAKGEAEARLEAVQNLPRVMQESDSTVRLIDQALNHPGLSIATGLQGRIDPRNYVPGSEAANFRVLLDQIRGGTFLQAFQQLKGGGAITEVEGRKAEQAIARLDTTQSEEAFRQSLQELRTIAENARARAIDKAQGGSGLPPAAMAPSAPRQSAPPTGAARVQSADDYARLPAGATYIAPDGSVRRKK